jgi:acetyl esterase/lipase
MKLPSLIVLLAGLAADFALSAADLAVPDNVQFERGLEYSNPDQQHLQLNLARPKTGHGPFPAVVCIHGGGFRAGTREGYDQLCVTLAQWLRANAAKYEIDPKRIGATGGSAGGHLALFLGVTEGVKAFEGEGNLDYSSGVSCVVSFSGPSDFTQSYGKSVDAHEVLPLFFGGNLQEKRREHIVGSPLHWASPNAAPALCIHGTADNYVAYEQAVWMVDRLKACAVEASLFTLEGAGHGFKGADAQKADQAMLAFFAKHLKP